MKIPNQQQLSDFTYNCIISLFCPNINWQSLVFAISGCIAWLTRWNNILLTFHTWFHSHIIVLAALRCLHPLICWITRCNVLSKEYVNNPSWYQPFANQWQWFMESWDSILNLTRVRYIHPCNRPLKQKTSRSKYKWLKFPIVLPLLVILCVNWFT